MRTFLLLIALAALYPGDLGATESPAIHVAGKAVIHARADTYKIHGWLTGRDEKTLQDTDQQVRQSLEAMSRLVPAEALTLTSRGAHRETRRVESPSGGETDAPGAFVSWTTFTLTFSGLEPYQKAYRDLLPLDGISIQRVEYVAANEPERRAEARDQALLAARAKAERMAKTLGATLGDVIAIHEEDAQPLWDNNRRFNIASSDPPALGLREGDVEISAAVRVVFALR
jgi:hypothetical protein